MKIADGMRNIADNIIASHNVRARALGDLVNDVSGFLADTRKNRKAMSKEQAAELAHFAGDLAGNVAKMIKDFAADRKTMSKEQSAELARFAADMANRVKKELELMSKDRALSAKELKGRLQKEARDLRNLIKKTLSDYSKDHAEMSEALRHNLRGFVKDIVKSVDNLHLGKVVADLRTATRGMLGGYRADMNKAGNIWGNMTNTLAKASGKKAALPVIRAKEDVGTVLASAKPGKEAVRKVQKRKKRKK